MVLNLTIIIVIILGIYIVYYFNVKPKLDPLNKAISFSKQNKIEDAITEYKRVLYTKPDDPHIHYQIAELYLKLQKFFFQRVLDIK